MRRAYPPLLYLSGPMSSCPKYNYPAFHAAARRLRTLGHSVLNPAETAGADVVLDRSTFMRIDTCYVQAADAVVLLPGWENSRGAKYEVLVAHEHQKGTYLYCPTHGLGDQVFVTNVKLEVELWSTP